MKIYILSVIYLLYHKLLCYQIYSIAHFKMANVYFFIYFLNHENMITFIGDLENAEQS